MQKWAHQPQSSGHNKYICKTRYGKWNGRAITQSTNITSEALSRKKTMANTYCTNDITRRIWIQLFAYDRFFSLLPNWLLYQKKSQHVKIWFGLNFRKYSTILSFKFTWYWRGHWICWAHCCTSIFTIHCDFIITAIFFCNVPILYSL